MKKTWQLWLLLSALALSACGGENSEVVSDDPYAGDPPLFRSYAADVAKEDPPSIRLTLQLRRNGVARLIFQHGTARAFREERGRWSRDGNQLLFERNPAEAERSGKGMPMGGEGFAEMKLPELMRFTIGPKALVLTDGVIHPDPIHFRALGRN